jgi:hypothetical protein
MAIDVQKVLEKHGIRGMLSKQHFIDLLIDLGVKVPPPPESKDVSVVGTLDMVETTADQPDQKAKSAKKPPVGA